MTATLDPQTAGDVYRHALEPRHRGRLRQLVVGALDLWCANFGGTFELTRSGDVVVRRRLDGVEELRVEVYSAEDAAETLHRIGAELEELGADEFRARWSID